MVGSDSGDNSDIEIRESVGSVDLEVGSVFKTKNSNDGLSYVYLGCHNLYSFTEIDSSIFTTNIQECEDMVHLFFCKERNEYTSFKWVNADLLEEKVSPGELKDILNNFHNSPIGAKIKGTEFHINHLSFNNNDLPVNYVNSKIALFKHSFFKEINKEDKIYLVIEWDRSTKVPNYKKFTPHIIRVIDDEKFTFDYIPQEHWVKFKGVFNLDKIEIYIKEVDEIAKKKLSLLGLFSKHIREAFYQEKIKNFQRLKLGSLYLIYSEIKK